MKNDVGTPFVYSGPLNIFYNQESFIYYIYNIIEFLIILYYCVISNFKKILVLA